MSKTVNILGDTPKQQWLNAIGIYELCITENARFVKETMCDLLPGENSECGECDRCRAIGAVIEQSHNFADEMKRLVEGVFGEE